MARNYYIILGVESDATPKEIQSAYRSKAKELHPDRCSGSSEPFRDVQEAYETLRDPGRRRTYDQALDRTVPFRTRRRSAAHPPAEPLIPREHHTGLRKAAFDRYSFPWVERHSPWGDLERPSPGSSAELEVTIRLSRARADQGGRVRVILPLSTPCPTCWGQRRGGFYTCWECGGEGTIPRRRPVWVTFPAGVSNQTSARLPLDPLGLPDATLMVQFEIIRP